MDTFHQTPQLQDERIEQIVEAVQAGDKEQYRLLVLYFQRRIYVYCHHMLGNRTEAEDAVQEVFLKAYHNIGKYRRSPSFSAWLYKIAYHHCLNLLKQRNGLRRLLSFLTQEGKPEPRPRPSGLVEEILESLPADERQLLILRTVEERSFAEIAEITGASPANLRKKFERIRKKLNKRYNRKEFTDTDEKRAFYAES
jgi:RNA polymerase sigma-70 factor (ECF subfamily)